jgi:hypothetical protein
MRRALAAGIRICVAVSTARTSKVRQALPIIPYWRDAEIKPFFCGVREGAVSDRSGEDG